MTTIKYLAECQVMQPATDVSIGANLEMTEELEEIVFDLASNIGSSAAESMTMPLRSGYRFFDAVTGEEVHVNDVALEVTKTSVLLSAKLGDLWIHSEPIELDQIFEDLHPLEPYVCQSNDGDIVDLGMHRSDDEAKENAGNPCVYVADKKQADFSCKMVEISVGHIKASTAQELAKRASEPLGGLEGDSPFRGLFFTPWGEYGWIFNPFVEENALNRIKESYPDLVAVLDYAKGLGAYRLQLDKDAHYVEELQSYDW